MGELAGDKCGKWGRGKRAEEGGKEGGKAWELGAVW
jgi:hypothetical protein